MRNTISNSPRAYVGTWAKYNDGDLSGRWMDLDDYSDYDEFMEAALNLHSDEEDPEIMIQDTDNLPEWMKENFINEYGINGDVVWDYVNLDEDDRELIDSYVSTTGFHYVKNMTMDEILDEARDAHVGTVSTTFRDWVIDFFIDCNGGMRAIDIINNHSSWIDYESVAMTLDNEGYFVDEEDEAEMDIAIRERCQTLSDIYEESWLNWDNIEAEMEMEFVEADNGYVFRK